MPAVLLPMNDEGLRRALQALQAGEVIAFATETVFGVGADARNPAALNKIYELKGRPAEMPLQVLTHSRIAAEQYGDFSDAARKVASVFWPGPLTMVVPEKAGAGLAPQAVSAQGVGLRVPNYPALQQLLESYGAPIAASSANRSGQPPANTAQELQQLFGAQLALILEGSGNPAGKASTVVLAHGAEPQIVRAGAISDAQILTVWKS